MINQLILLLILTLINVWSLSLQALTLCDAGEAPQKKQRRLPIVVEGQKLQTYGMVTYLTCPIEKSYKKFSSIPLQGPAAAFSAIVSAFLEKNFEAVAEVGSAQNHEDLKKHADYQFKIFGESASIRVVERIELDKDRFLYFVVNRTKERDYTQFFLIKKLVGSWIYTFEPGTSDFYTDFLKRVVSTGQSFPFDQADRLTHELKLDSPIEMTLKFAVWNKKSQIQTELQTYFDTLGGVLKTNAKDSSQIKEYLGPKSFRFFAQWENREEFWQTYKNIWFNRDVVAVIDLFPTFWVFTNGKSGEGVYMSQLYKNAKGQYKMANLGENPPLLEKVKKPLDLALRKGPPFSSLRLKNDKKSNPSNSPNRELTSDKVHGTDSF